MDIFQKNYSQQGAAFVIGVAYVLQGLVPIITLGRYDANLVLWIVCRVSDEAADAGFFAVIKDLLFREPFHKRHPN